MQEDIRIIEPSSDDKQYVVSIQALLKQLSSSSVEFGEADFVALVESSSSRLFLLLSDGNVCGMLTLAHYLAPTGRKMWIEDVVVDSAARGKGYGKRLVEHAIEYARAFSPCTLMLTSNPARIAANELYRASGFQQKTTNVYKMSL